MGVTERGIPKFFCDIYQIEREKGEQIGEKRGEKKGDNQARLEIAEKMFKNGATLTEIVDLTELSEEKIKKLMDKMK